MSVKVTLLREAVGSGIDVSVGSFSPQSIVAVGGRSDGERRLRHEGGGLAEREQLR